MSTMFVYLCHIVLTEIPQLVTSVVWKELLPLTIPCIYLFFNLPLDHYEAVSKTSEQRRYEHTPVSTSSRSQAVIKLYCWHYPIRRSNRSYTKKNILIMNIVLGKTKSSKQNLFRWNIPLKNLSRGMYPTWKAVIQMA